MGMLTDDDLRERLQRLAETARPAVVPALPEPPVVAQLVARDPRVTRTWWAAAAGVVAALGLIVTSLQSSTPSIVPGSWRPMAEAPIPARAMAATVWTGEEMVVVGGESPGGEIRRDAAAYNPQTDTWRAIPDAPEPVLPGSTAVWTGSRVVVFPTRADTIAEKPERDYPYLRPSPLALDVATGEWSVVEGPAHVNQDVNRIEYVAASVLGDGIVAMVRRPDRNAVVWFDGDLSHHRELLAVPGDPHPPGDWVSFAWRDHAVFVARTAMFAPLSAGIGLLVDAHGRWSTIPQPDVVAEESGDGWVFGQSHVAVAGDDLLVTGWVGPADEGKPKARGGDGKEFAAVYDLAAGSWQKAQTLAARPQAFEVFRATPLTGTRAGVALIGGTYTGGLDDDRGGLRLVFDRSDRRWRRLPDAPVNLHRAGHSVVWTGLELIVWGGLRETGGVGNRPNTPANDGARLRL